MNNNIENIVTFCILMENDDGILDKSPDYIMEKFNRYIKSQNEEEYKSGLDWINKEKLNMWRLKWLKK